MSRKKSAPAPPPPEALRAQRSVINLKGSDEYIAWLEAANRKTHISKAAIFRVAVAEWAVRNDLPDPPEI